MKRLRRKGKMKSGKKVATADKSFSQKATRVNAFIQWRVVRTSHPGKSNRNIVSIEKSFQEKLKYGRIWHNKSKRGLVQGNRTTPSYVAQWGQWGLRLFVTLGSAGSWSRSLGISSDTACWRASIMPFLGPTVMQSGVSLINSNGEKGDGRERRRL